MTRRHIFLLLWLLLVVSILAWTIVSYDAQSDAQLKSEIVLRHGILMLGLTLPSGWILTALIGSLAHLVGLAPIGLGDTLLVSLTCAVAGYLQWFVVVPWLWRKWRARRVQSAAPSA